VKWDIHPGRDMEMNVQLLQWGLFSFMVGCFLSLPLSAVIYNKHSSISRIFINVRKLKSSHLDYLTQAFAMGFAYLLGYVMKTEFNMYVFIPLIYGSIMNPTILLLEATPWIRSGILKNVYKLLKATSPVSLLLAWLIIAMWFLPFFLKMILLVIVIFGGGGLLVFLTKTKNKEKTKSSDVNAKAY
jgi:hypothetical protein